MAFVYLDERKSKRLGAGAFVGHPSTGTEWRSGWGQGSIRQKEQERAGAGGDGLLPKWGPHLIILNKSGSLILTVRATFQDT